MSQQESQFSAALRRACLSAPQSAPPALGEKLRNEFRRHHILRRRKRNARLLLVAACVAASVITIPRWRPRSSNTAVVREPMEMLPRRANVVIGNPESTPAPLRPARKPESIRSRKDRESAAERFVALPTFDSAFPIDHLEIVRVDLPGQDLRLVGFPVTEEIANRRVVADVLLAQDGTPYALRLVQNSRIKEQ